MQFIRRLRFNLKEKTDDAMRSMRNSLGYYVGHRGLVRVFLSSTYTDLAAERQALSIELGALPIQLFRMEDYTGVSVQAAQTAEAYEEARLWSWKTTEQSDVVVFLIGKRYGDTGTTLLTMHSFVQMEFGWTRHYGPKKSVLAYRTNVPFPDDELI